MNFLKELEKKSFRIDEEPLAKVHLKTVEKLWRVFWLKRKKELKAELKEVEKSERQLDKKRNVTEQEIDDYGYVKGVFCELSEQLEWIEKQLKEVKK